MRTANRSGTVLIVVVLLVFAMLALAALLIDIGMSRLAQLQMQGIADAAAIEGAWQLAAEADPSTARDEAVRRAEEMTSDPQGLLGWGPHRLEFETDQGVQGYDLDGDGVPESAQTIRDETLGQPIHPTLDPNYTNAIAGDVVIGDYDVTGVPEQLPGQPINYERGPAFQPNDDGDAMLVRARRTGEESIEGGTSAERVVALWSRGSIVDFGFKGRGIAVRGESIADLSPVAMVGPPGSGNGQMIEAIPLAIEVEDWRNNVPNLMPIELDSYAIGSLVSDSGNTSATSLEGYLSIYADIGGQSRVVAFGIALLTRPDSDSDWQMQKRMLSDTTFSDQTRLNASANLSLARDQLTQLAPSDIDDLLRVRDQLDDVAVAPLLVRSQQIQGVTP